MPPFGIFQKTLWFIFVLKIIVSAVASALLQTTQLVTDGAPSSIYSLKRHVAITSYQLELLNQLLE